MILLSKIADSISSRGFLGTVSWASKCLAGYSRIVIQYLEEKQFDCKWEVHTSGCKKPSERTEIALQAERYQGTAPGVFEAILNNLSIDTRRFVFVDLGCGKGRALIMAAAHSFKAVIGVEFDQELSQIAEMNLRRRGLLSTSTLNSVICGDAGEYSLPDEHIVVYLFNPFKSEVMRRVLHNICAPSSKERYIIYYNPVLADELCDQSPHLDFVSGGPTIPGRSRYAVYKVRLHGSARESP